MKRLYRRVSMLLVLAVAALCGTALGEGATSLPQLDDYFTERDLAGDWDATATLITLTGDTAETSSHVVAVEDGVVTILDGGTYVLTGALNDGQVVVDVKDDEKVQLVLSGVDIACADSAAIRVKQADKVFVTLAEGTVNTLTSAGFADETVDAVIFSDEDLTFNGTGTLVIDSPAGSGIDGKDDVKLASGTYVITAAGRGVDANDSIRVAGGDFTVVTEGTAFRANHASNADLGYVYIWGGTFGFTTGGGAENGASATADMGFGGFGPRDAAFGAGEMPQLDGEMGEMSAPPEGFEGGEMPERPDFGGETGEMPAPPEGFEEGEMPEFNGEMPAPQDMAATQAETEEDDAVSAKGFKASGDIAVLGGTFRLDTADDAFHADGDLLVFDGLLNIASGDDGLHADGALNIVGGTVNITRSSEGLEAEVITVAGGEIALVASDDGLNARSSTGEKETFAAQEGVLIHISGGALAVNAYGDGIDSNGDILVSGGTVVVSGPENNMNGALDCNGTATVTGGTVVAAGASGMAENFSESSTQAAFLVALQGEAGEIAVTDAGGGVILSAVVEKSFGTVVVSCPGLVVGETYTVSCGDAAAQITLTDTVTGQDTAAMGGMMGGGWGGMPRATEAADGE